MEPEEPTCGQELAADAEVPELLARLMSHVATNMDTHARWVGVAVGGRQEQAALLVVAREYRALAEAASRAAVAMKAMKDLPAAAHDPARLDRTDQARWMRAKIEMQLELARMLTSHAEVSQKVLTAMEG